MSSWNEHANDLNRSLPELKMPDSMGVFPVKEMPPADANLKLTSFAFDSTATSDEIKRIRAEWESMFRGNENQGRLIVVNHSHYDIPVADVSFSQEEFAVQWNRMLETKRADLVYNREQLAENIINYEKMEATLAIVRRHDPDKEAYCGESQGYLTQAKTYAIRVAILKRVIGILESIDLGRVAKT